MISTSIDKLIMQSMKEHDNTRTETLRAIKTAFLNWKTAKENVGKELDEATEIRILKKLQDQRMESHHIYHEAGRYELAGEELDQAAIIADYLPDDVTEEDILSVYEQVLIDNNIEPVKRNMGVIIKNIKSVLPAADGKLVSEVVMKKIQ